uniref:Ig-like domain-containing protein n=1 Tax=Anabas testudineus TaxID=64144 RepID=A0A3Q1IQ66_ANATE
LSFWKPAKPGDTVDLSCRTSSSTNITAVEWKRPDLRPQYVFVYRSGRFNPDDQHQSFRNRVELKDEQMEDGDVSIHLKNVRVDDTGTYECRVQRRGNVIKTENVINLTVEPGELVCVCVCVCVWIRVEPGELVCFLLLRVKINQNPHETTEDISEGSNSFHTTVTHCCFSSAGDTAEITEDGENKTEPGQTEEGHVGLTVGLSAAVLLLLVGSGFVIFRICRRRTVGNST